MLKHGIKNKSIAKEKYTEIMRLRLNKQLLFEETGLITQPALFWLEASPDGLVVDSSNSSAIGVELNAPTLWLGQNGVISLCMFTMG